MIHVARVCPEHGRAVSCVGEEGDDILVGTCDWGNHPVTVVSDQYIADHRAGKYTDVLEAKDFEDAIALAHQKGRGHVSEMAGGYTPIAGVEGASESSNVTTSELSVEYAKLSPDAKVQFLAAVKRYNSDVAATKAGPGTDSATSLPPAETKSESVESGVASDAEPGDTVKAPLDDAYGVQEPVVERDPAAPQPEGEPGGVVPPNPPQPPEYL